MKQIKTYTAYLILSLSFTACSKDNLSSEDKNKQQVIQQTTNKAEVVRVGEPNCTEAISGKIKLKVSVDSAQTNGSSTAVRINSKTEKLYPSGGYILVYELVRTNNNISLEYKQVNTACGNPAAGAFLPATSSPTINNLAVGSYPIEIKLNGMINKGQLVIPAPPAAPSLQMQATNGLIIE